MAKTVLITGGAGFLGSHLADQLLATGHQVRALDALVPQVHGPDRQRPAYLDDRVDLRIADVCDRPAVDDALEGVDAVVHLAAAVRVGQSRDQLHHCTRVNQLGTAVLLEALADRPIDRLVVASSASIYGEGRYQGSSGRAYDHVRRQRSDLDAGRWDPLDLRGTPLVAVPTPEDKEPSPASIHALSKYAQERMCLVAGEMCRRPTVALRVFDTYGPRQSLGNPHAGVLASFAGRLLDGRPPLVFEDGRQQRDFVSVHDVARACRLALTRPDIDGEVFNIGSGQPRSVLDIAAMLSITLGVELAPEVVGQHRAGDIRHCFADLRRAAEGLGYAPSVKLEHGLRELGAWLRDRFASPTAGIA